MVDVGYVIRLGFLSPDKVIRYRLKEFGSQTLANHKEPFNLCHSFARMRLERAFGALKGRFKILTSRPFFFHSKLRLR